MTYLSHAASFHSNERIAPSNRGIKHLIVAGASDGRSLLSRYNVPGARALATAAYSLYLSHKIAFHFIASREDSPDWLHFTFAFGLALVFGAALYYSVERPFLKLRDRWDGRTRTPIINDDIFDRKIAEAA